MPLSAAQITKHYEYDTNAIERVSSRKHTFDLTIVEPNPTWPAQFQALKSRIENALGPTALSITHTGSTSIPNLPAKNVIDIDVTVPNILDEDAYIKPLEEAGFHFLHREPKWHEHRFFVEYEPSTNLHVFGLECPEVERHRIFRDWLLEHEDDRELYARVKREAATATREVGGTVMEYNSRKDAVVKEILERAFRSLGYIQ